MTTSGTYNFGNINVSTIIEEAWERVGLTGNLVPAEKKKTALRSLNFMLSEWAVKNYNVFNLNEYAIQLTPGQAIYTLPPSLLSFQTVSLNTPTRLLSGVPSSSDGGTAANAFDSNINTSCTQTAINGNISYDYGTDRTLWQTVRMVGIMSTVTRTYSLVIESSLDGVTWDTIQTVSSQSYPQQYTKWIMLKFPSLARQWRIRETNGAILDIAELYFSIPSNNSLILSQESESGYQEQSGKATSTTPNQYVFRRGIVQSVLLWPIPKQSQVLLYSGYNNFQDTDDLILNIDAPQRFYEALVSELAFRLAIKSPEIDLNRISILEKLYLQSFMYASKEDKNKVPIQQNIEMPSQLRWHR